MDRCSFFFLELLTFQDLNKAFTEAETADRAMALDAGLVGVAYGGALAEHSPQSTVVVVAGPMAANDKLGERIFIPSTQNLDIGTDNALVSTAVVSPGNSKIVSIFVKFARNPQSPVTDGNGDTVYFDQFESFAFYVVQGAEAVSPTPPSVLSDGILLGDVTRTFGDSTIANADISTARREDIFVATQGSIAVRTGQAPAAVGALTTQLGQHVAGAAFKHPAADLNYAGGSAWLDSTTNPAASVEAQLDKVITDLISTTSPNSGAQKIGCGARTTWLGGRTNPGGITAYAATDKIITDLAAQTTSDDGAERIGGEAGAGYTIGSVRSQLDQVGPSATTHWTGTKTFDDIAVTGTARFKLASRSLSRVSKAPIYVVTAATINFGGPGVTVPVGDTAVQELEVPDGATLTAVKIAIDPANATPPSGGGVPVLSVIVRDIAAGSLPSTLVSTADPTSGAGYGAVHTFTSGTFSFTVDRTKHHVYIAFAGETGGGASSVICFGATAVFTTTALDDGAA